MNDAKSAPFAHMPTVKKSMYTPQVTKKPTIPTNNAKFTNHFPIRTMVNGTLKIYSKSCKIHPIHPPPIQNHAKFMHSAPISQGSLYPLVKLSNFVIFAYFCIFADFAHFTLAGKQPRLQRFQQNPPSMY